jgi:hypothetical protein
MGYTAVDKCMTELERRMAGRVADMHEGRTAGTSGYDGVKDAFHEAVADRYEPFQHFKWSGKKITTVEDEDEYEINVETPKEGSMEMAISFFWESDGDEYVEKGVEKAVHNALKDLNIEFTDHEQDNVFGGIPQSFVHDNPAPAPDLLPPTDYFQVYVWPNGKDRIRKLKARGHWRNGRMEFGVDVWIEVGLAVEAEPV